MGWTLFALWEAFWLIWAIFALITGPKNKRIKLLVDYILILAFIPILGLFIVFEKSQFPMNVLPNNSVILITGLILILIGLSLAIWSRIKLGKYWSGEPELLPNHKLIRDGPYKIVRHPIYLGILFGTLGTAIILGDIIGLLLFISSVVGFSQKIRNEEVLLLTQFASEFEKYKKDVKMLIPFLL